MNNVYVLVDWSRGNTKKETYVKNVSFDPPMFQTTEDMDEALEFPTNDVAKMVNVFIKGIHPIHYFTTLVLRPKQK